LNDKISHYHVPWIAQQYLTFAKYVVPETNSIEHLLWKFLKFMSIAGGPVSWNRILQHKIFLGRVTILLSCQHFSSCANSNMISNWLRDFLSVLQKVSAISFSHSHLISEFQKRQSVFKWL